MATTFILGTGQTVIRPTSRIESAEPNIGETADICIVSR